MARTKAIKPRVKPGWAVVHVSLKREAYDELAALGEQQFRKVGQQGQALILAGLKAVREGQGKSDRS